MASISTEKLVSKIQQEFENNSKKYEPFIRHIRFPKYKNLEPDARLNVTFPLTVLVGENGTNKSSVMRAFYGAPVNKSLGEYWFETKVDKIKDDGDKPSCFIYGYFYPVESKIVEVLKTRVKKDDNPDYWEPSRPIQAYGMEPIEEKDELSEEEKIYRSKTRWNAIKKDVVYLDFRHEALSAYDRFFYCTDLLKASSRFKTKQEYIRRYSANIKEVIDEDLKSYKLYGKEKVITNRLLNSRVVNVISEILDKKYLSVRILTHSFYTSEPAKTIILTSGNGADYTEAFAGSGEFSVVTLVDSITNAKNNSLILLDEPEVSIHPEAQKRLLDFLLQQIITKKLQIILATHSPYFTHALPLGALKLLKTNDDGTVGFDNAVQSSEVVFKIGASKRKLTVVVEDICAKIVLEACLRNSDNDEYFNVGFPGRHGAEGILVHDAATNFMQGVKDVIYLLDGDIRKKWLSENSGHDPKVVIDSKLTDIANNIKLLQQNTKNCDEEALKAQFAEYLKKRVLFFPDAFGPEEIVYSAIPNQDKTSIKIKDNNFKKAIQELCSIRYRNADAEHIKSYLYHEASSLLQEFRKTEFDEALHNIVDSLVAFHSKVISAEQ